VLLSRIVQRKGKTWLSTYLVPLICQTGSHVEKLIKVFRQPKPIPEYNRPIQLPQPPRRPKHRLQEVHLARLLPGLDAAEPVREPHAAHVLKRDQERIHGRVDRLPLHLFQLRQPPVHHVPGPGLVVLQRRAGEGLVPHLAPPPVVVPRQDGRHAAPAADLERLVEGLILGASGLEPEQGGDQIRRVDKELVWACGARSWISERLGEPLRREPRRHSPIRTKFPYVLCSSV